MSTRGPGRWTVTALGGVAGLLLLSGSRPAPPWTFVATFPGSGLVANETDVHQPPGHQDPTWLVTSGSLFADDGTGWTGPVDGRSPDATSSRSTGSAVFRVVTRAVFGDCRVSFQLRIDGRSTTRRTPSESYDGVHVFVRYQDPANLYAVSVDRRDGTVAVKRKTGAGDGESGDYVTLAQADHALPFHVWTDVAVSVATLDGRTTVTLSLDGSPVLTAQDDAQPVLATGRVGLRGDNTEFHVRDFTVVPYGWPG